MLNSYRSYNCVDFKSKNLQAQFKYKNEFHEKRTLAIISDSDNNVGENATVRFAVQ